MISALGVTSARKAVREACWVEGKSGCSDLGIVSSGSSEACFELCGIYWGNMTKMNGVLFFCLL